MGWKIPKTGDFVGFILGSVPRVIKYFKDKNRIKNVDKIEDAVDSGDDSTVNKQLQSVIKKDDKRRKANS